MGLDGDPDATTEAFVRTDAAAWEAPVQVGAYRLLRRLGEGGFGEVHLAEHPALGRVALKLLKGGGSAEVRQFVREGTLVLSHPGVPRILDHGEADGRRFLAQEYVEGRDLRQLLEDGALPEERALSIASQIADVLAHAHARGIVHRDLKPRNVVVGEGDRVFVLDFGIAAVPGVRDEAAGRAWGTPAYMAPEQAAGGEVGPPADLYALGVILYLVTTGRLPHVADTAEQLLSLKQSQEPAAVGRVRGDLSAGFQELVGKLLCRDPRGRPSSAAEVVRTIDAIRNGLPAAGRFPELGRAMSGAGSIAVVTGKGRQDVLRIIVATAEGLDVAVVRGRARAGAGAHDLIAQVLPPEPGEAEPDSRFRLLESFRRRLCARAAGGPALLLLEDLHVADDGSLDVIQGLAGSLPSLPVLLLLSAPALGPELHAFLDVLACAGRLSRQTHGEPEHAPEQEADLPWDEALGQARRAMARFAPRLAESRYRALAVQGGLPAVVVIEAAVRLGVLLRQRDALAEAQPILEDAVLAARAAGERVWLARALRELAAVHVDSGRSPEAEVALEEAGTIAAAQGDRELASQCWNTRGALERRRARPDEALRAFREAMAVLGDSADAAVRAGPLGNMAVVLVEQGRLSEAREATEACLALRRATGDAAGACHTLVNLGNILTEMGDHAGARRCYEEALAGSGAGAEPRLLALANINLAGLMRTEGEIEQALHREEQALAIARKLRDPRILATSLEHLGALHMDLGDGPEAHRYLQEARSVCELAGDRAGVAESSIQEGELWHREGRCAEAQELLQAGHRLAVSAGHPVLAWHARRVLAFCRAMAGDAPSLDVLAAAVQEAQSVGAGDLHAAARRDLAEALAHHGRRSEAIGEAAKAIDLARTGGQRRLTVEALRLWERLTGASGAT